MRTLATVLALVALGTTLAAQQKTAANGVYSAAQAARGAALFESQCASCHKDGGSGPDLKGDRFTRSFGDASLITLFTSIKTTMPRMAPGTLSDAQYTDVIAHLLRLNGFPDGMNELAAADLESIKIPGQSGSLDFALIQVVGCLSRGSRGWTLSSATEPTRTREPEAAKDPEAGQLDGQQLGSRTFQLQQVYSPPEGWTNQKVAAKGFLTKSGAQERLSVTSLRALTSACSAAN